MCRPPPSCASRRRSASAASPICRRCFRSHLRNRWPNYSERLKALHESARDSGDPTHLLLGFANSAAASLARLREEHPAARSRPGDRASWRARETIYCLGQRRAFSVAHYLTYALGQLGLPVRLVDNVGGLGPEQVGARRRRTTP